MKFSIVTFGCKVNSFESEAISQMMINNGYELVDNYTDADIVVFNSCTVTSKSEQKLFQLIRKVKRENATSIVVLTGCMPQAFPELGSELQFVDVVLGNSNRKNIVDDISLYLRDRKRVVDIKPYSCDSKFEELSISKFSGHTRAFLKIEDGCNRYCSYCIIPYARGTVRSNSLESIYNQAKELADNGYKEIVLSGINLSSYGKDLGLSLCDAIDTVCKVEGIERVRLGSLEPETLTVDVVDRLCKQEKLCPQFHLSLQSGSDRVLKRMRRLYTAQEYLKVVNNLREKFRDASFTTDIMVGFPGETEEDFQNSIDIISKVGFLKVHVFPYSKRPGTMAYKFPNQVDESIKSSRVKYMLKASEDETQKFLDSYIGSSQDVLYEKLDNQGFYEGYTKNYILVKTKSDRDLSGKILTTKIESVGKGYCIGKLV